MLILSGGGAPENVVPIDRFFSEQIEDKPEKDSTTIVQGCLGKNH